MKISPIIVDIETGPRSLEEIEPLLPAIAAPTNYKDQTKIDGYVKERRDQLVAGAALSAVTGRVLAVGILRDDDSPCYIAPDDEAELLRKTWRELEHKRAGEVFVTFYGHRFDFPFLARRSWANRVAVPEWFPRDGRYPRHAFVDLAEFWQCGDRGESISLDRLAKFLGLPGKNGSGADFATIWQTDRAAALEYLASDLRLTRAIFERINLQQELPIACADCGGPIGQDAGPSDGWQLEDGRTVCHPCCLSDTRSIANRQSK
jgi:Predicted 3'-5' exonuclease related to the exonuclease domain of PolB